MSDSRILLYDFEIMPHLAYVWDHYETTVVAYKKRRYPLCFAYKWLGQAAVHFEDCRQGMAKMLKKLWRLHDEADIVMAYNGINFDNRLANTFFMENKIFSRQPPSPFEVIDPLKVLRRKFKFANNKMDAVCEFLGIQRKQKNRGIDLWLGCENGDPDCWREMKKYNTGDIPCMEKIYEEIRPWIPNHPRVSPGRPESCAACGNDRWKSCGIKRTKTRSYRLYRCMTCGAYSRSSAALLDGRTAMVTL